MQFKDTAVFRAAVTQALFNTCSIKNLFHKILEKIAIVFHNYLRFLKLYNKKYIV